MAKRIKKTEPAVLQLYIERGLRILAVVLGVYHMSLSIYRYYAPLPGSVLETIDYALAALLAAAAVFYCLLIRFRYPQTLPRLTGWLRRLLCPEQALLILLLVWYFICCFAVGKRYNGNWFEGNAFPLLDTFINTAVLFPLTAYMLEKHRTPILHAIMHLFTVVMTLLMLIVVWNVFQLNIIDVPGGQIGMTGDIRLSINCHPNTGGAYAALMLMLCLYMISTQGIRLKVLYICSACIHLIILMLTNSRTSFLAVAICYSFFLFMLFWKWSKRRLALRCVLGAAAAALCFALFVLLRDTVFFCFESMTRFSDLLAQQNRLSSLVEETGIARELTMETAAMQSRYDLWLYALKAMFYDGHKTLFGVTPISVIEMLELASDGVFTDLYTHNQFLEVGVSLGIPGLLLYTVYLILLAGNCLRVGLSSQQKPHGGFYTSAIVILMLVLANLTEATLLFYHYLSGGFFFLLAGWVTVESRNYPPLPKPLRKKK